MKTLSLISIIILLFSSCLRFKKGCTDADALNYDPNANTDNHLCCYAYHPQGSMVLEDTDIDSPYFMDDVVLFELNQDSFEPATNDCPEAVCAVFLKLHNITPSEVHITFSMESLNGIENWTYIGSAVLPPNGMIDMGKINSECGYVSSVLDIIPLSLTYE